MRNLSRNKPIPTEFRHDLPPMRSIPDPEYRPAKKGSPWTGFHWFVLGIFLLAAWNFAKYYWRTLVLHGY